MSSLKSSSHYKLGAFSLQNTKIYSDEMNKNTQVLIFYMDLQISILYFHYNFNCIKFLDIYISLSVQIPNSFQPFYSRRKSATDMSSEVEEPAELRFPQRRDKTEVRGNV